VEVDQRTSGQDCWETLGLVGSAEHLHGQESQATWKEEQRQRTAVSPLRLSTERWAFTVKGEKHACMNKEAVYEILQEDKIKTYWQKKDGITNDAWGDINWKSSKVALKEQPRGMKRFGAKFATRHIATGRMIKLTQEWTHSTCPQCGAPEETTEHVCQCPAEQTQEMWKLTMKKLEDHMKAKDTEPAMQRRIMMHLESWHDMSPPTRNGNSHRQLAEALEAQTGIGWRNFLLGRTAKQLEEWQQ
jgi:predicted RNA-binding Zn-ribbon protein involved in translation (DUF1610 family)